MARDDSQPNIARAVRRSRRARAAIRSRRRRVAAAAAVSLALAGAGTLSLAGFTGGDVVHAAVSQAQSLAELLDQRSPGQRTEGQLTKVKKAARAQPKQRPGAAPRLAHNEIAPPEALTAVLVGQPVELPPEFATPVALAQVQPPPTLGAIVNPPSGGSAVTPPGGSSPPGGGGGGTVSPPGGGGPVTLPTSEPREPLTPPSAVPEPGTWALMLLGFGLVGWRIRRAKGGNPQLLNA
jgi:hypothetical protein